MHGWLDDVEQFWAMPGLWWGELLTALRELILVKI
jgi:hypothetical protein